MTLKILISGLLFVGLASTLVFGRITPPNAVVKVDPEQSTRNSISRAYEYYKSDDYARALADFTAAIDSVGFTHLPDELRHDALALAGYSALKQSEWKVAQRYLTSATGLPSAKADDWHKKLRASWALQDYRDSALCISTIAQRWPDSLANVNTRAIFGLAYVLEHNPTFATAYQRLLQSLFDARWTDDGLQPSGFWYDLARMLLQQNRDVAARAVAERIDSTRSFLSMRIDRRFDVLTRGVDFDADRSIAEELVKAKLRVAKDPTKLQRVVDLQALQLSALQFDEVLRTDDAIIANVGEGDTRSQYSDFADVYVWILDSRARALRGLGRWDEALQQQRLVAQHAGSGKHKVSQALNLGARYAFASQADNAVDAISDVHDASPYGLMVRASILLLAAMQRDEKAAVAEQLDYMREHRSDAIGAYQDVLFYLNDLDAAEALLIERLRNQAWRSEALSDVQNYADVPRESLQQGVHERRLEVAARPSVIAEIAKVGRVMTVNLAPPFG